MNWTGWCRSSLHSGQHLLICCLRRTASTTRCDDPLVAACSEPVSLVVMSPPMVSFELSLQELSLHWLSAQWTTLCLRYLSLMLHFTKTELVVRNSVSAVHLFEQLMCAYWIRLQHIVPHFHAVVMATTNEKSTGEYMITLYVQMHVSLKYMYKCMYL